MPDTPTKKTRGPRKSAHAQTIDLRSGGTLTLSGTFNLFNMSVEDVEFVSELGRKIREYNDAGTPQAKLAAALPRGGVALPKTN
jgi:hypothetical protein